MDNRPWSQQLPLLAADGRPESSCSPKSSVLVILPPTHKCPDLERILSLARTAFSNAALNLLDLNLRFEWVSKEEILSQSESVMLPTTPFVPSPQPAASSARADQSLHQQAARTKSIDESIEKVVADLLGDGASAARNATPRVDSHPAPHKVQIKAAEATCFRVFVSSIAPTLSDADILALCPADLDIIGATFYPPKPLGPKKALVRSVVFAFAKAKHAKEYWTWIKQQAAGPLADKFSTQNISAYFLAQGMQPEDSMTEDKKAIFLSDLGSPLTVLSEPLLANVPAAGSAPADLPEAQGHHWRLLIDNLIGSLSKETILTNIVPHGIVLAGATLRPPKSLGQGRPEIVRAVQLAFHSQADVTMCHSWIKKHSEPGGTVAKLVFPTVKLGLNLPSRPAVDNVQGATPASSCNALSDLNVLRSLARDLSPLMPCNLPEVQDCHWKITVGNLRPSLSKTVIAASFVPRDVTVEGITMYEPRELGTGRPELVRYVQLGFNSEAHAKSSLTWIKTQATQGGILAGMVTPGANIWAPFTVKPPVDSAPDSSSEPAAISAYSNNLDQVVPLPLSDLAARHADAAPASLFRLTVGNLLHHLSKEQLFGALIPPGIVPTDMTLQPPQQLTGRPELCRSVVFVFDSESDMQATHDWVRSQAVACGRIVKLMPPNVKVVAAMYRPPPSSAGVLDTLPTLNGPIPSSIPLSPRVSAPAAQPSTFSDGTLPEASPTKYRLHVSNLKPDLDLAPIVAALVPHDVQLAGASLFAPRPMGGSKRDLVRSLKFAFHTESDAKRCQDWIKKNAGGSVAKVVAPGAKIVVGNPMDPMVSDPAPMEPVMANDPYEPMAMSAEGGADRLSHECLLSSASTDQSIATPPPPLRPAPHPASLPAPLPEPSGPPLCPKPCPAPLSESMPVSSRLLPETASRASTPTSEGTAEVAFRPKLYHISINGIDPAKPVSTVLSSILGLVTGAVEPVRMGVRNAADGRRGVEFVFDSEASAKQFVLQVWTRMKEGKLAGITADGGKLTIGTGSSGGSAE